MSAPSCLARGHVTVKPGTNKQMSPLSPQIWTLRLEGNCYFGHFGHTDPLAVIVWPNTGDSAGGVTVRNSDPSDKSGGLRELPRKVGEELVLKYFSVKRLILVLK